MNAGGWIAAIPAALGAFLAYLFLIAPNLVRRKRGITAAQTTKLYAHRGLHGEGAPENSLAAYRRAVERGYGVEWDVRAAGDGTLILCHDANALRMCGVDRLLSDMTIEEVRSLRLGGTEEGIPTLEEALRLVEGKIPLIVEIKPDQPLGVGIAKRVWETLKDYPGPWWVESFDPRIVRWFRLHAPDAVRGQLAYDPKRIGMPRPFKMALAAHMLMNFLSRPDFVAYGCRTHQNPSFRLMRRLFHPVTAAWTVKSPEESRELSSRYDVQIFEGFLP